MPNAIEMRGISKTYGAGNTAVVALDQVDFTVASGEFVAIMGPSGSGKSTLLAVAGGLDSAESGEIRVGEQNLRSLREAERAVLRRRTIGFVFQSFNLVPVLTAAENVALPLLLDGAHGRQVDQNVAAVLAQVGLKDRAAHRPSELSGGQQQRVAVARALVTRPAIVLADEPTGNLDSKSSHEVLRTLRTTCDALAQTVVLITHDAAVAAWADRAVYLRDGRISGECRPPLPAREQELAQRATAVREAYERYALQGVE